MRDSDRLDTFYTQLKLIHQKYCPDWRFMQLVCNIQSYFFSDMFYCEEDKFLDKIKEYCEYTIGRKE